MSERLNQHQLTWWAEVVQAAQTPLGPTLGQVRKMSALVPAVDRERTALLAEVERLRAVAEAAQAYREKVDDFDALTQSRCPDGYEYENWQRAQLAIANGYDALMAALEALEAQR